MPTLKDLTKEKLIELYEVELLTEKEIAEQYDTYQVKINRLRGKWDIPTLGKTGRMEAVLPEITPEQHEVLIGSLLGDGWMSSRTGNTACFSETHSEKQEEYLRWKACLLDPYVTSVYPTTKKQDDRTWKGFGLLTHTCTYLYPYYEMFYPGPSHARKFPKDLHKHMTSRVLAIWYCDDGSLPKASPNLTFGLDEKSLQHAIRALKSLGLVPTLTENRDNTTTITFPKQADKFFELIAPHMPPCMAYKIAVDTPKRVEHRNAIRLTPEVARDLTQGGMSCQEVANIYQVSPSTVKRRLKGSSGTRIQHRHVEYSVTTAEAALSNYDSARYKDLSDRQKAEWEEGAYRVLSRTQFPYPLQQVGNEAQKSFQRLQDKIITLDDEGRIVPRTLYGVALCDGYFPNRFKAQYKNYPTCEEGWAQEKILRKAIKIQLKGGDPLHPDRVRKAVQYQLRTPTVFRPGVAKYIYQTYASPGDTVWDPCSGYGGRMVGALSANVKYMATDVEPETVRGNLRISQLLDRAADVRLFCIPAEEFNPLDHGGKVQLVFTSPPYFDREKYSERDEQSWVGYKGLEEWLVGFLRPVIRTAFQALKDDGVLALNICNLLERKKVIPLEEHTIQIAKEEGFYLEETIKMPLSNLSPRPHEPIFIFKKAKA